MKELTANSHPVILYDGKCILCNTFIKRIIALDRKEVFCFAPLQGNYAKECDVKTQDMTSVFLIDKDGVYQKSDAVLRISSYLHAPHNWLQYASIIPTSIRDSIYDVVANNRYSIFGKKDQCIIPDDKLKERFLM